MSCKGIHQQCLEDAYCPHKDLRHSSLSEGHFCISCEFTLQSIYMSSHTLLQNGSISLSALTSLPFEGSFICLLSETSNMAMMQITNVNVKQRIFDS